MFSLPSQILSFLSYKREEKIYVFSNFRRLFSESQLGITGKRAFRTSKVAGGSTLGHRAGSQVQRGSSASGQAVRGPGTYRALRDG